MENFVFENRTKVLFGRQALAGIGPEVAALGGRALLVHGRESARRSGLLGRVADALAAAGVTVVEFGGVRANPVVEHVRQGIALARLQGVEVVVAVGGGSVIDSAKAICAGVPVEHDVWRFFRGKKGVAAALPLACVATVAGSGSELNGGMVLTNQESGQKIGIGNRLLQPRVAVLDPTLTCTVPPDHTAFGAVDIVAHLLEFYCTTEAPRTPVQDRFMEGLAMTVMESCDRVLAEPADYQGRAELLWCGALALSGLPAAGLGWVGFPMHMLAHALGALFDVPHGASLAVVMPAWLGWRAERQPARIASFAGRVFALPPGDAATLARQGIDRLTAWFAATGCPASLADLGITADHIPALADAALPQAKLWRLRDYSRPVIETILHRCLCPPAVAAPARSIPPPGPSAPGAAPPGGR